MAVGADGRLFLWPLGLLARRHQLDVPRLPADARPRPAGLAALLLIAATNVLQGIEIHRLKRSARNRRGCACK